MNDYRIFGAEVSPYSVKVRAYFRYKGIPHQWIVRDASTMAEYQKYAKLPIIPVVVAPDGEALQDSTPIIEAVERRVPEPSIHPPGGLRFLSELIEEFADEWGNKWMFHYRWAREADQASGAERIAALMISGGAEEQRQVAAVVRERMVGRAWVIGSNEATAPIIEASFKDAMALLEFHFADRPFLFGGRPSLADFGLWGQVYNAWTDPTPGEILRSHYAGVCAWVERMMQPRAQGEFEAWSALAPTLEPFLRQEVAPFLQWSAANANAIDSGTEHMTVQLPGGQWQQSVGGPQKYHAKTLREIRRKYVERADDDELREILRATGCLEWLA